MKNILIIGANGFIGSALIQRLSIMPQYNIVGIDINDNNLIELIGNGLVFHKLDITQKRKEVEKLIAESDIVIPLVAIANPSCYIETPLKVFELTFEENLHIIRLCHQYKRRVIVFSTSEVYGMCEDDVFDERLSSLVLGPIENLRWIYSASKQLLDRVVYALGQEGLKYTIIRPFNWIGPCMDREDLANGKKVRLLPNIINALIKGEPVVLVDGGEQKRCFIDIKDAVNCLVKIIDNRDKKCDERVINIGSIDNELSIIEFAAKVVNCFENHPMRNNFPKFAGYKLYAGKEYYGSGYQDVKLRKPAIEAALECCEWRATKSIDGAIKEAVNYAIKNEICQN